MTPNYLHFSVGFSPQQCPESWSAISPTQVRSRLVAGDSFVMVGEIKELFLVGVGSPLTPSILGHPSSGPQSLYPGIHVP